MMMIDDIIHQYSNEGPGYEEDKADPEVPEAGLLHQSHWRLF